MSNNIKKLTFMAVAVAINIVGSKIALFLHLPCERKTKRRKQSVGYACGYGRIFLRSDVSV